MTIDIHFSDDDLKTNSALLEALKVVLFENKENTKMVQQDAPIVCDVQQDTGDIKTTYSLDDLRTASSKIMKEKGCKVIAGLIKTVGGNKLTDIPIDKYDLFMEKLQEIV